MTPRTVDPVVALAGALAAVVVVAFLAGTLVGQLLFGPEPYQPAWSTDLLLVMRPVIVAAGILTIGALGWGARSRLVDAVYVIAGGVLLVMPSTALALLDIAPVSWLTPLGGLGAAMLATGVASLVARRSAGAAGEPPVQPPGRSGRGTSVPGAILGAAATLAVAMAVSSTWIVITMLDIGRDWPTWAMDALLVVTGPIIVTVDAVAVLVVGALATRVRSLVVGGAYVVTGALLLALPWVLTVLDVWPPWWLAVIPAAGDVEAALLLAGSVSIGLAIRRRRGDDPTGRLTDAVPGAARGPEAPASP
jgi:hypothetical protein